MIILFFANPGEAYYGVAYTVALFGVACDQSGSRVS